MPQGAAVGSHPAAHLDAGQAGEIVGQGLYERLVGHLCVFEARTHQHRAASAVDFGR
jgi:hypothetical protein